MVAGMYRPRALMLLATLSGLQGALAAGKYRVRKFPTEIPSFDGTILMADVHVPTPTHAQERFPVVIFPNSWAQTFIEYFVEALHLADEGYLVLEYATRGWPPSSGMIEGAGPRDQKDISAVISYVLSQSRWQPDPNNVGMAGISYGAGLSLLGAGTDPRIKTAVAMSGWANSTSMLFEDNCPNLWFGELLVMSGELMGHLDPQIGQLWREELMGNTSAFREWAKVRSAELYIPHLEQRQVPLFLSNNLEDGLMSSQNMLDFFTRYNGPKRLLLNQGAHATAELIGLAIPGDGHVWHQAIQWLNFWLKGQGERSQLGFMDVQLRTPVVETVREVFTEWPSRRIAARKFAVAARGRFGMHGILKPEGNSQGADEAISFSRITGITSGVPVVSDITQALMDKRITSMLPLAPRSHSIWYYAPLKRKTRFCGIPVLNIDVTPNSGKWQIAAYLFAVNWFDRGTLLSHMSLACWDCEPHQRVQKQLQLKTFCEDVSGGLGLALTLHSDVYEPANDDSSLSVTVHYTDSFNLTVPEVVTHAGPLEEPLFL